MAYRKLRLRRINRLIQHGYSPKEARQFTAMRTVYPDGTVRISSIILNRPYTRLMMRERLKKYRQAVKEGISVAEYRRRIYQDYVDNDWITKDGQPDLWKEYRHYYRMAIQLGLYKAPPRKYDPNRPHKKLVGGQIDREHVRRQATKYRGKTREQPKAMTGNTSEWIEQLRQSMKEAKTPEQREQFRHQIERLDGTP